jgi:hypothetical protein
VAVFAVGLVYRVVRLRMARLRQRA